jgi:hypothetical protein
MGMATLLLCLRGCRAVVVGVVGDKFTSVVQDFLLLKIFFN